MLASYILRRLLLIIPTLWAIITLNFLIVQFAPGGPVEQAIVHMQGLRSDEGKALSGGSPAGSTMHTYAGSGGVDPEIIKELERMYGFDKPAHQRYWLMIRNYMSFDLGKSYYKNNTVLGLIKEKLPTSITLGFWSTLLIYLIAVPLGIAKARYHKSRFDRVTSGLVAITYAIPSFLFAILLIVFLAGGSYFSCFPLRGIVSDNWATLPWYEKITDYIWHIILPITSLVLGGFAALTMLIKNSFIEEISKPYVLTARAKGLTERDIIRNHVLRNAALVLISHLPATLVGLFFTGTFLVEVIFSLDGLGLLGFESAVNRDYPVVFGTLYIFTLLSLVLHLLSDILYALVDPRIDFNKMET
ncbi:MAG: microcin C ABC transporter permease YejB [Alphaproteobacteria bacterium]|nr:MAG: microcin C ABC transporter permease YejB [Alphaproteobacteria bacterium]